MIRSNTYSFARFCSFHRKGQASYAGRDDSQHGGGTIVPSIIAGELQFGRGSGNEALGAHLPRLFSYKDYLSAVYDWMQSDSPLMWN
jgi:hypothetical protein